MFMLGVLIALVTGAFTEEFAAAGVLGWMMYVALICLAVFLTSGWVSRKWRNRRSAR